MLSALDQLITLVHVFFPRFEVQSVQISLYFDCVTDRRNPSAANLICRVLLQELYRLCVRLLVHLLVSIMRLASLIVGDLIAVPAVGII